ncbi:MAG TPA: hypothetical protein PKE64_06335 [Anaerolineae bacterium]|nr:hypothetical protein [Anaerolineae bacterium]HMR63616.1 hypothetical protein [Anaerolineae bacterium]
MLATTQSISTQREAVSLAECLGYGDPCASYHLARLIKTDAYGVLQPFAQALAARIRDELERWAELGVSDLYTSLDDEVYSLLRKTANDWDGLLHCGDQD